MLIWQKERALPANRTQPLLKQDVAERVAELFKVAADPTRVRIIGLLAQGEQCVGELSDLLQMSQPAISHQLRLLRTLHVVAARRQGKHVFYRLDDEHVEALFAQALAHVVHA